MPSQEEVGGRGQGKTRDVSFAFVLVLVHSVCICKSMEGSKGTAIAARSDVPGVGTGRGWYGRPGQAVEGQW